MFVLTIILVLVALLGSLPLILFLKKRSTYRLLLKKGHKTSGSISEIIPGMRGRYGIVNEKVFYFFTASDGRQYSGMFVASPRKHRRDEQLEVYYMPGSPLVHSIKTSGYGAGYLVLMIIIAVAVIYMTFKIYELVDANK
jgi:hypothetical protein